MTETKQEETKEPLEQALELLHKGIDFYNQKPHEDEIDLVKRVRDELTKNGINEKQLQESFDNSRFVKEAQGRHSHAQQYNLNRYLCDQFTIAEQEGADTRLLRYQLLYEVKPTEWEKIFKDSLLPGFLELGLPKAP